VSFPSPAIVASWESRQALQSLATDSLSVTSRNSLCGGGNGSTTPTAPAVLPGTSSGDLKQVSPRASKRRGRDAPFVRGLTPWHLAFLRPRIVVALTEARPVPYTSRSRICYGPVVVVCLPSAQRVLRSGERTTGTIHSPRSRPRVLVGHRSIWASQFGADDEAMPRLRTTDSRISRSPVRARSRREVRVQRSVHGAPVNPRQRTTSRIRVRLSVRSRRARRTRCPSRQRGH